MIRVHARHLGQQAEVQRRLDRNPSGPPSGKSGPPTPASFSGAGPVPNAPGPDKSIYRFADRDRNRRPPLPVRPPC